MYQLVMKSGIPFSTLMPLIRFNQRLKVIVYDPGTDRVGSRLKPRSVDP